MTVPDYRISLPPTRLDFDALGIADGQDISNYPAPGAQARYDWMRSIILGLLSQQASYDPPNQAVIGTLWFDLNTLSVKIRIGNAWVSYSQAIGLTGPDINGNVVTLAEWYESTQNVIAGLASEVVFSGICNANGIADITIPESLQAHVNIDAKVFLHINGVLIDPHNCNLIGSPNPTTIRISGAVLSNGDTFIISIRRINTLTYLPTTIVIP